MTLMRMLIFKPQGVADVPSTTLVSTPPSAHPQEQPSAERTSSPSAPESSDHLATSVSEEPIAYVEPSANGEPSANREPSANGEPSANVEPPANRKPSASDEPSASREPSGHKEFSANLSQPIAEPGETGGSPLTSQPQPSGDSLPADESGSGYTPEEGPSLKKSEALGAVRSQLAELGAVVTSASQIAPKAAGKEGRGSQNSVVEGEGSAPEKSADAKEHSAPPQTFTLDQCQPSNWLALYRGLEVRGVLHSTVANCVLSGREGNQLYFILDESKASLFDENHRQRLADLLTDYFGGPVKVHIELQALSGEMETPAMFQNRRKQELRKEAIARLQQDPVIQVLEREFLAQLDEESVTFSLDY